MHICISIYVSTLSLSASWWDLVIFFVNFYYGVQWQHLVVYHRALNNTTENDHNKKFVKGRDGSLCDNPLVTRGSATCILHVPSFCHNSTLHNEKRIQDHLHHYSYSQNVLGREHSTFRSHCSACHSRSHRSRERVLREMVVQEESSRIRPGWGWRRLASPASPKTWPGAFLRLGMERGGGGEGEGEV